VTKKRVIHGLWIDDEALRKHLGTGHHKAREPLPFLKPTAADRARYEEHFEEEEPNDIPKRA